MTTEPFKRPESQIQSMLTSKASVLYSGDGTSPRNINEMVFIYTTPFKKLLLQGLP